MKRWPAVVMVAVSCGSLFLAACGGGGSSGSTPPPASVTAPSGLSYTTPQVYTVGQAITPITPTVTGTVVSYSVSPALPAGLSLDQTKGTISGTPSATTAQAKYTVTATNSAGSATSDITLTVNEAKPGMITYPSAKVVLATGFPTADVLAPVLASGAATSWSITPALPAGLTFNTTNGRIAGTPTADSAATVYTIAAINSGGQSTFALTLRVQSGVLLDLGHVETIRQLRFDGNRVLSQDLHQHWILWNYATGARIANGDAAANVDFAGQSVAISTATGFEIRAPGDGHVTATIATSAPTWWKLATDGSYLVAGNAAGGIQVWSAAGTSILSVAQGNYTSDHVFAAPGELRAAITVGGAHVIETTDLATGVATDGPSFNGQFSAWFADGSRYLVTVASMSGGVITSTTVYTYSLVGAQLDATVLTVAGGLRGAGDWFGSSINNTLYLYKVGSNGATTFNYAYNDIGSCSVGGTMFCLNTAGTNGVENLTFLDVSGATPVRTDEPLPPGTGSLFSTLFAAVSPTQWVSGNLYGVLFDGASTVAAPRYLDYGAAWSIAGSGSRYVISTASGRALHYDAATSTLENTINDFSGRLRLSFDGAVLAAGGAFLDFPIGGNLTDLQKTRVYNLPGDGLVSTWPGNNTDLPATGIFLSAGGGFLGQLFAAGTATVTPVASGSSPTWTNTGSCPVALLLSPDGSHIACPALLGAPNSTLSNSTVLAGNGSTAPLATLNGLAVGWLDNDHLLVGNYVPVALNQPYASQGATIYNAAGVVVGTSPLPELHDVQVVTSDSIYAPKLNAIFSVSSGAATWSSTTQSSGIGAAAGSNVVFASGRSVVVLPQ